MKRPREKHELDVFPADIWTYIITNFVENPGLLRFVSRFFANTVTTKEIDIKHMTYSIELFKLALRLGYVFIKNPYGRVEVIYQLITYGGNLDVVKWLFTHVTKWSNWDDNQTKEIIYGALHYNHVHIIKWATEGHFVRIDHFNFTTACKNNSIDAIKYTIANDIVSRDYITCLAFELLDNSMFELCDFLFKHLKKNNAERDLDGSHLCFNIKHLSANTRLASRYLITYAARYEFIYLLCAINDRYSNYGNDDNFAITQDVCYKSRENKRPKLAEWLNSLPDCPCHRMYH